MAILQTVQQISTRLKRQAKLFVSCFGSRDLVVARLVIFVISLAIMNTGKAEILDCNRVESIDILEGQSIYLP